MSKYVAVSDLVSKALKIAAIAHEKCHRKGTEIPYIVHPVEVAMILQKSGLSDTIVAAGLLHDTLEDTELTKEYIKKEFGDEILRLVLGASEKLENRKNTPWIDRKKHTIEYLKNAELDIKILACADKLSNIKSMIREYEVRGDEMWSKFTTDKKEDHKWYYKGLVDSLKSLEDYDIYMEFKYAVNYLFGNR